MQVKNIDVRMTLGGECELLLTLPQNEWKAIVKLMEDFKAKADKAWQVEIAVKKKKRSLDANAALWKMLSMMAGKLNTTKDELYLEMLDRHGVFTHIVVKPNVVNRVKQEWKTVRELGEITINGKPGIQLQCYFGSSTYDSKEFSILLDGVIQEAKEIGIDFISREEQETSLS